MSALGERLRGRGIGDPGGFLAWCQGAGYLTPLDGSSDRDLDALAAEYRQATGRVGLAGGRGLPPRPMTPEQAHRMVEEGAQRHRDRMQLERVARQVVRSALQQARSQWPHCGRCTRLNPCHRHGG